MPLPIFVPGAEALADDLNVVTGAIDLNAQDIEALASRFNILIGGDVEIGRANVAFTNGTGVLPFNRPFTALPGMLLGLQYSASGGMDLYTISGNGVSANIRFIYNGVAHNDTRTITYLAVGQFA